MDNMADSSKLHEAEELGSRSASALRELEERARTALEMSRQQASRLEVDITSQLDAITATLASEREIESQHAAEAMALREKLEQLTAEYDEAKNRWLAERAELDAAREERARQAAKLEAEQRKDRDEWSRQLNDFESKLREQQSAWDEQQAEVLQARTALEAERDALQQKFELALEDVQRYRGRVGELEQELARRPEATAADSAELVALRAERDALAERAEQLERQSSEGVDADTEQHLADLQRRFEMAVEDVRELKTKNAKLEAQLAAGEGQKSRPADAGGMDWESQKRRLLASLQDEGEPEPNDVQRQQERVRIAGTIEITDAIVAEKDREIAELRSQLAARGSAPIADAESERINELLDADEVIAEHRAKIAQLERDMEATLRAAELELSIERAKIARERVELDETRAEIESLRNEIFPNGPPAPGAPRRRWLSKLGLNGDEQ
jgi:chromosome segregation ATPase